MVVENDAFQRGFYAIFIEFLYSQNPASVSILVSSRSSYSWSSDDVDRSSSRPSCISTRQASSSGWDRGEFWGNSRDLVELLQNLLVKFDVDQKPLFLPCATIVEETSWGTGEQRFCSNSDGSWHTDNRSLLTIATCTARLSYSRMNRIIKRIKGGDQHHR
jgi:hypothetical protein